MASLSFSTAPSQGRLLVGAGRTRRRSSVAVASLQPNDESRPQDTPLPLSAKHKPSPRHSAVGSSNGAVVQSDSSRQSAEAFSFLPDLLSSPLVLPDSIDSSRISSVEKAIEAIRRGEVRADKHCHILGNLGGMFTPKCIHTRAAFELVHCPRAS